MNPTLDSTFSLSGDAPTVPMPGMFARYRSDLNDSMRSYLSDDHTAVYDMLRYYLGWVDTDGNPCLATEGKALRPTLCLFACEATGGSVGQAMPAAVALELIHSFSLIHDDIQDGDETRHHRPTLWAVWDVPKALTAGNVLRMVADRSLDQLVDRGMDHARALDVVCLLTEAYLEMVEGQYLDISYEGRHDIGMRQYFEMIARKTGALIRCSLNLGALIGSGDPAAVDAFRSFGRSLGYVFQIQDDVLGVWGDQQSTGKPVGADITRKKSSLPVVHAMSESEGSAHRLLVDIYRKESLDEGDVADVLEIMDGVRTREYALRLAAQHCEVGMEALSAIELEPEAQREAEELAHFLLVRQH